MGELDRFRRCQEHLALWLRGSLTGCHFATSFSSTRPLRLDYYTPISETVDLAAIAGFIDGTAARDVVAVVLFPSLRTPRDLLDTLLALRKDPRWEVSEATWPEGRERPDSIAISVTWQTAEGDLSDAMGVAPLGTMPVTRRAPHFAIIVWGGAHRNEHLRKPRHVGVASAPTGLDKAEHARLMKVTDDRVRDILREPAEDPVWLRQVGFILPREVNDSTSELLGSR